MARLRRNVRGRNLSNVELCNHDNDLQAYSCHTTDTPNTVENTVHIRPHMDVLRQTEHPHLKRVNQNRPTAVTTSPRRFSKLWNNTALTTTINTIAMLMQCKWAHSIKVQREHSAKAREPPCQVESPRYVPLYSITHLASTETPSTMQFIDTRSGARGKTCHNERNILMNTKPKTIVFAVKLQQDAETTPTHTLTMSMTIAGYIQKCL